MGKIRTKKELSEEIDLLDVMLSSLIDLLNDKGILTREEWEKKVKENVRVG